MSEYRIAKLESLLARVLERRDRPRAVVALVQPAESVEPVESAPATIPPASVPPESVQPVSAQAESVQPASLQNAATTPPPPPVAVPEVSIPRQPVAPLVAEASTGFEELESTSVSRSTGPAVVPLAAQSHARIATADRIEHDAPMLELEEPETAPVSSERTVDPSVEADIDSAQAPPESTRQLATNPPPQSVAPRISSAPAPVSIAPAPVSVAPESAPRSVGGPVITRGSLPPDAIDAVEFRGEVASAASRTVGDLLDATLLL